MNEPSEHPVTSADSDSVPVQTRRTSFLPLVQYYFVQCWQILRHPKQFFDHMPVTGGYVEPALFLCFSAFIYAFLQAVGYLMPLALIKLFLNSVIKTVILSLLVSFILNKIGGKGSTESTFRVFCYGKATLLFAWIALGTLAVGGYASLVYSAWLNIIGCSKVHELPKVPVAAVVITITLIAFLIKV